MGKRNVLQSLQPCCKDRTVLVGTGMSQKRYANVFYKIDKKTVINDLEVFFVLLLIFRISGNVINRYQVFDVFKVFVEDNNGNSG